MRRTERRGYRLAKAVEVLVEVRRRTENLIPSAYAKRSLPNGKQMRRSWLQPGQGTRKPGQDGRESNPCGSRSVRGKDVSSVLSQALNRFSDAFSSSDKCLWESVTCCVIRTITIIHVD